MSHLAKIEADHSERTRATLARLDRHDAIRRRADRIVDRVLPALPQPNVSTRHPELNGAMHKWLRWERRCAERNQLRKAVRDRIEAKVPAADEAVRGLLGGLS